MTDIIIETERLILRQFKEDDAEALSAVSNHEYVLKWMPDWKGTVEETRGLIKWFQSHYAKANKDAARVVLAVTLKESGELIGVVGIGNKEEVDNEIEIAFFVSEEHNNKGYISEAARAMTEWAFSNLHFDYLMAIVEPDNVPSQRVLEKCGFAKFGTKTILNSGETKEKPYYYYRVYNKVGL